MSHALTTFSSELPEPLNTISQITSDLVKPENMNDERKRNALVQQIRQEVERLNNLVVELPKIIEAESDQ